MDFDYQKPFGLGFLAGSGQALTAFLVTPDSFPGSFNAVGFQDVGFWLGVSFRENSVEGDFHERP